MASTSPEHTLIVGCGDIGRRVARRLLAGGHGVLGLVASPTSADRLATLGIPARVLDLDQAGDAELAGLAAARVLWLAPPPAQGDGDPRLRRWLAAAAAPPQRLLYLSTPAVYGDCGGRWIDEGEPMAPQTPRGHRRADAEAAVLDAATRGWDTVRVRVPGIYGPGRLPLERLASGHPIVTEAEAPWSNRIHAEDLADALLVALQRGRSGTVYHLSDGHPSSMSDYFIQCARVLDLPEPPRVTLAEALASFNPALASYLAESRRLDTRRLRDELKFTPRYPQLSDGLKAIQE